MTHAKADSAWRGLVLRAGRRWAALPLSAVVETMRPLPVEPLPGMPPYVTGMSVVRAKPVPVVDLNLLLAAASGGDFGRFVTVRSGTGTFVLAVTEVLGIRGFALDVIHELPHLLGAEAASVAFAVVVQDERLVALLHAARLVPSEAWLAMQVRGTTG
jgi:purine-binding chemotaxis protein CheW